VSSRTPISDLFGKPTPAPAPQPGPRNPSGVGGWLIVAVLAVVLGWVYFNQGEDPKPDPKPDDQEQVEPSPAPKIQGKTLVFVHERNPQPIEHDLLLREMPKFCGDRKLQFRALDDDLTEEPMPALKAFASSKNIDPPFVILTDGNDKPSRVIKWPTDIAGLGELFK